MENEKRLGPPYGPPANLKQTIDIWRDRSMPEQVTKEWFEKAGMSANLAPRNLHGLRYLGLVDAEGNTTEVAERLRTAPSEDFATVFEEIVRKAYAPILKFTNPSEDSRTRVEDAFRREEPSAQRARMVTCFIGLCAAAGIPLKESPPQRDASANAAARRMQGVVERRIAKERAQRGLPPNTVNPPPPELPDPPPPPLKSRLHPAVQAWIDEMPPAGTQWERNDFENWLAIFKASVERAYKI